jgi:signal transduction histidine kinase
VLRFANAVLSVTDDGMGIPAGEQARVFDRFFRTNLATSRAVQGTGLGLAICKAITDSHNGTISVESQPGRGTIFRVRPPLTARTKWQHRHRSHPSPSGAPAQARDESQRHPLTAAAPVAAGHRK